jgi:L-serine dehydratase
LKIALGPSSSHTLGALKIGQKVRKFLNSLEDVEFNRIKVKLLGSFALTGKGHLTDKAIIAGLNGYEVDKSSNSILNEYTKVNKRNKIDTGIQKISFSKDDIILDKDDSSYSHPNTVLFTIYSNQKKYNKKFISIGGGEIEEINKNGNISQKKQTKSKGLTRIISECNKNNINIIDYILSFEKNIYGYEKNELYRYLGDIWDLMEKNIEDGIRKEGVLPGNLQLNRRAKEMYDSFIDNLRSWKLLSRQITLSSIYAIAVAEENASGAKIVTAPTCGSAGVIPATLKVMMEKYHYPKKKILNALLVAGLLGAIAKGNASISGAEVGCQGEIGVASSMAAGAICFLMGGTLEQIDFAAEIALEHHLGLTCDPAGGLVQIPCIERNAVGAITALNSANLSLLRKTPNKIKFDSVLDSMMEIGGDMSKKYKETSLGGLASRFTC